MSPIYQKMWKLDDGIMLIFVGDKSVITFGEGCIASNGSTPNTIHS